MTKHRNSLKLGSWNANRGFLTKGKIIEAENIMKENNLDICAISEVDIQESKFHCEELYEIDGYKFVLPKSWRKGRARIIVYYKKSLEKYLTVRTDLMTNDQPDVWVEMKTKREPSSIYGFYYREFTSINGDNSLEGQKKRLEEWTTAVDKIELEDKEMMMMGDVNIDAFKNADEDSTSIPKIMKECCLKNGLDQLVNKETRSRIVGDKVESSCLDHIYSNRASKIRKIKITKVTSSDHDFVTCSRDMRDGLTPDKITVRSYSKLDPPRVIEELMGEDWEYLDHDVELDESVEILTKNIQNVLDRLAPKISFIPKSNNKPWISTETRKAIKERDVLYKRCKRSKSAVDAQDWRRSRNKVIGLLKRDKKSKKDTQITKPNDAWKVLRQIDRKAEDCGPPKRLRIKGEITNEKTAIAEHMNNFFVEKVEKNLAEIEKTEAAFCPIEHFKEHIEKPKEVFEFIEVTEKEVKEVIDELKPTCGVGADEIPNKVIKMAQEVIVKPLTRIINKTILEGKFPKSFKESIVVPLYKKNDRLEPKNQRPIYILNKLSLCLESVLLKQMTRHWTRLKLISPTQHGYIENRSCITALTAMYDEWTRNADQGKWIGIYLLDQSSAFELVDPYIMMKKLEALNVEEKTNQLIFDYLTRRPQRTKIQNYKSTSRTKNIGVAPGSKLGPLLYSIYTTDLPKTTEGTLTSYADDSTNSVVDKTPQQVKVKLELDAKRISDYMRSNRLLVAEDKSVFLLVSSKHKLRTEDENAITIRIGEHEIKQSESAKILGVTFDKTLEFKNHLFGVPGSEVKGEEGLIKQLKKRIGLAYKIKNLPFKIRKMIMTAIFSAKMTYGMEVWGAATKGQIHQVQLLQKRAARIITRSPRSVSTSDTLKQCGWMDVQSQIDFKTICLIHKTRINQSIPYFEKHIGRGRDPLSFKIPVYGEEEGLLVKRATLGRFKRLWNQLPDEVRKASITGFKRALKVYFMNKNKDDDDEKKD